MITTFVIKYFFSELLQEVSNKASSKVKVKADAKVDLSNRLPIVVFLQSIEIERLLSEVESWKFKYLDLDRRISSRIGIILEFFNNF